MNEQWRAWLKTNKWKVLSVAAGIVLCILIFTINFWRTLLLCAIVAVCYLVGALLDQGGIARVKEFFESLLPKG
ncbi:MAG: DUF2273 domain-containing protein [Bacillota bacterium]